MASMNKVFLMGNLTRDPESRQVGDNNTVCNFRLAVNRRYTTAGGEDREDTCFVDIEAWRRQAETCQRYLSKGSPVLVEGRLRQDRWEDRESGAARSRLLVSAERVQFLSSGGSGGRDQGKGNESTGSSGNDDKSRVGESSQSDTSEGSFEQQSGYNGNTSSDEDIPF